MDDNLKTSQEKVQELKELGNACVRQQKYEEAILHYSNAANIDPKNYSLFSNRSLAFLKKQQYYYAMEDAKETIRLKPDWAKAYFRKGEIENVTFNFDEAIVSYRMALSLQPHDETIIKVLENAQQKRNEELRADQQLPWLGAGVGIILGVLLVIADYLFTTQPTVSHPLLMALLTISVAMFGYITARLFRYYVRFHRAALLDPPVDLLQDKEDNGVDEDVGAGSSGRNNNHRYTKAQARLRFKKGRKS